MARVCQCRGCLGCREWMTSTIRTACEMDLSRRYAGKELQRCHWCLTAYEIANAPAVPAIADAIPDGAAQQATVQAPTNIDIISEIASVQEDIRACEDKFKKSFSSYTISATPSRMAWKRYGARWIGPDTAHTRDGTPQPPQQAGAIGSRGTRATTTRMPAELARPSRARQVMVGSAPLHMNEHPVCVWHQDQESLVAAHGARNSSDHYSRW